MNPDILERPDLQSEPPQPAPLQPAAYQAEGEAAPSPLGEIKEAAGTQARQLATEIKESTGEALKSAKSAGNEFVIQQKDKLASRIEEYTDAVKAACESLRQDEKNPLAAPADKASHQLERLAQYVRQKQPMDFVNDLSDLARRRPEIFFGTMFVAGLAAVRFLKASTREERESFRNVSRPSPQNGNADFQYQPRPEPTPQLAPLGPPPALQTNNPSLMP